ncbi:MAG: GxxExxY protein [Candidatus Acidiferrales bacterium]
MEPADRQFDDLEYPEKELTGRILECAFNLHNALGAGFLERVYVNALVLEMRGHSISCSQESAFPVKYKGTIVGDYFADVVVEGRVILEFKACAILESGHFAQLLNYLRASGIHVGLLLNFGRPRLEYRRCVV